MVKSRYNFYISIIEIKIKKNKYVKYINFSVKSLVYRLMFKNPNKISQYIKRILMKFKIKN